MLYWFGYVQNSVLEVKRQGHATLSAVTTEFRERLMAHDQIARTTERNTKPWVGQFTLSQYLRSVLQPRSVAPTRNAQHHLEVAETGGSLNLHVAATPCEPSRSKPEPAFGVSVNTPPISWAAGP